MASLRSRPEAPAVEPIGGDVFVVGDRHLREALALNAQQNDRVDRRQDGIEVALHRDAVLGIAAGQKGLWADQHHASAEPLQAANSRVRDAAMQHVADDRDFAAADVAELFDERVDVEQGLRWMRVRAVARVDHVAVEVRARSRCGKPASRMAHDEHGDAHRAQRDRGIFERLALRRQARDCAAPDSRRRRLDAARPY